jgi:hypothetical protein
MSPIPLERVDPPTPVLSRRQLLIVGDQKIH